MTYTVLTVHFDRSDEHSWTYFLLKATERWNYLIRFAEVNILPLTS